MLNHRSSLINHLSIIYEPFTIYSPQPILYTIGNSWFISHSSIMFFISQWLVKPSIHPWLINHDILSSMTYIINHYSYELCELYHSWPISTSTWLIPEVVDGTSGNASNWGSKPAGNESIFPKINPVSVGTSVAGVDDRLLRYRKTVLTYRINYIVLKPCTNHIINRFTLTIYDFYKSYMFFNYILTRSTFKIATSY